MILCGISDTHPIGVDIERIDPSLNIETMKAVLHQTEFQYINSTYSNHERTDRFYKIWTQKEAYIKYMGTGFSANAHAFNMLDPKDYYRIRTSRLFSQFPSAITIALTTVIFEINFLFSSIIRIFHTWFRFPLCSSSPTA